MAQRFKSTLANACKGFVMGCAEATGLCFGGGSVAMVLGIYDRWIESLQALGAGFSLLAKFRGKEAIERMDFQFFIPLLTGLSLALLTMQQVMQKFITLWPELMLGLLLGVMMGQILMVSRSITESRLHFYAITICSALFSGLVSTCSPMDTPPEMLLFFGSGMVAATCLMVPGFSGVFILLILGKYLQVATAFGSILYHSKGAILLLLYGQAHAGMSEFRLLLSPLIHVLAPFAIGGILALWIFSSAIGFLLKNFRNMGMSMLLGLMLGSLHKLWPFREVSIYIHQPGQSDRIIQDIAVIPYWEEPLHICALILVGLGFMLNLGLTRILSKN